MFEDLIQLQQLDTSIDQARHRRTTVPQIARIEELRVELVPLQAEVERLSAELRELSSAEKEAEDHASLCEDKATAINASLYDGSVVSHKELEALRVELAQLTERQRTFEDSAIELMERAEPVEAERDRAVDVVATLESQIAQADAERVVAQAEIDAELDDLAARRAETADTLDGKLLAAYEELREQLGGIAVARLVGATCDGCHLQIPAVDLDTIRHTPETDLVHCPECMRILVR